MSEAPFLTLGGRGEADTRVRGSTFVAFATPAASEEEARARLAECERQRFDATHHCSAWRLRGDLWRANDAGEPFGSAGAPILAAIDGAGLTDCVVVVTRYFGGTKLGIGGLVRAYGEAAAAAIAEAPRRVGVPAVRLRIRYPYEHTGAVMRVLDQTAAADIEHGFASGGAAATVEFDVAASAAGAFAALLREATSGAIEPERVGDRLRFRAAPA